jgi:hypothetical protein
VDEAIERSAPCAPNADVFGQELVGTALIYVSGPRSQDKFFGRVIYLTLDTHSRLPEITAASGAP